MDVAFLGTGLDTESARFPEIKKSAKSGVCTVHQLGSEKPS